MRDGMLSKKLFSLIIMSFFVSLTISTAAPRRKRIQRPIPPTLAGIVAEIDQTMAKPLLSQNEEQRIVFLFEAAGGDVPVERVNAFFECLYLSKPKLDEKKLTSAQKILGRLEPFYPQQTDELTARLIEKQTGIAREPEPSVPRRVMPRPVTPPPKPPQVRSTDIEQQALTLRQRFQGFSQAMAQYDTNMLAQLGLVKIEIDFETYSNAFAESLNQVSTALRQQNVEAAAQVISRLDQLLLSCQQAEHQIRMHVQKFIGNLTNPQFLATLGLCPPFKNANPGEARAVGFKNPSQMPCMKDIGNNRILMQWNVVSQTDEQLIIQGLPAALCPILSLRSCLYLYLFAFNLDWQFLRELNNKQGALDFINLCPADKQGFLDKEQLNQLKQSDFVIRLFLKKAGFHEFSPEMGTIFTDNVTIVEDITWLQPIERQIQKIRTALNDPNIKYFAHTLIVGTYGESGHAGMMHWFSMLILKLMNKVYYIVTDSLPVRYYLGVTRAQYARPEHGLGRDINMHELHGRLMYLIETIQNGRSAIDPAHLRRQGEGHGT